MVPDRNFLIYLFATTYYILEDYLNAVPMLTISNENRIQNDMERMMQQSKDSVTNIELQLYLACKY